MSNYSKWKLPLPLSILPSIHPSKYAIYLSVAFSFIATRASRNLSSRFCLFFVASHFLSLWAAPLHWIVQCACAYLPPPRNGAFQHVHTFSKLYNTACNCFPAKPISSSKNAANPNSRAIAANYVRICSATTTTTKTIQGYLRQSQWSRPGLRCSYFYYIQQNWQCGRRRRRW